MNNVYEADAPPFDPFPTVTLVVKTAFCPLAMVHDLFHGLSSPIVDEEAEAAVQRRGGWGVGKFYHYFTALVKYRVGIGELPVDQYAIRRELERERQRHRPQEVDGARYYIEPWLRNRIAEGDLVANEDTYFEVQVSARTRFRSKEGVISTFLVGKIDELDLQNNRIIERTTRGERGSPHPPSYKDYQVWLLWKIISSLNEPYIPRAWRRDYSNTKLFVETPHDVYEVDKNRPEFEDMTIRALSLIRDVSNRNTWVRAISRIYQEAIPECRSQAKQRVCGIVHCYMRRRRYPRSRPAIHREFRWMYLPLLWDAMWKKDKLRYQLVKCSLDELRELGVLCEGRIIESERGKLKISLSPPDFDVVRRRDLEERGCKLLIGSPAFGIETDAWIEEIGDAECTLSYEWRKMPSTHHVSLLFPEASLFRIAPVFLNKQRQRHLFSLERWGKDIEREAMSDPTIQLLEATFGRLRLDAGGGLHAR
jgi:hypothetical protein